MLSEAHLLLIASACCLSASCERLNRREFPDDFMFGVSSSAVQVEGAWNENGKGENIWDHFTHTQPARIIDGTNADIACDSYHKLQEDASLIKELGVNFYRFSLSWSRILPKGFAYKINPDGIRYYNKLIDLLIENEIIPMVALFHWDTPQPIEVLGGFTNVLIVNWFEEYARIAFENFGPKVKYWVTFNEPNEVCQSGYGTGDKAPGYNSSGIADYMCAHNVLKSHARVYHLYNNTFKPIQNGRISIAIDGVWYEPASNSLADLQATNRAMDFKMGWFADPIYNPIGDYPLSMKQIVSKHSQEEQLSYSRLPQFTNDEVDYIKGTYDYFALNYHGTFLVAHTENAHLEGSPYDRDLGARFLNHASWTQNNSTSTQMALLGFRRIHNWIKNRYGDVEIITENGFYDDGNLDDKNRIDFLTHHLSTLLDIQHRDKVKIKAYTVRSLLDSFEWENGYTQKYGLYHVNFSDPNRTRTPKSSAVFYKELIMKRQLTSGRTSLSNNAISVIIFMHCVLKHLI